MRKITVADMIKCADREAEMRKQVYPKWIELGKIKRDTALHELIVMRAIARYLRTIGEGVDMADDVKDSKHE